MGLNRTGNDNQQTIGSYFYFSDTESDEVNDIRFKNDGSGSIVFEVCTVRNDTKNSGTWIEISSTVLNQGITLSVNGINGYLSGIKNKIETDEILTIPENYEYNIFKLDVDGIVNNNGEINFL